MFGFRRAPLKELSPQEVRDLADRGAVTLVDVRESGEWAAGHLAGAVHAPLSELRTLAPSLTANRPVVFYCRSGGRSSQAVALCREMGLPHDTHMAGGILAWAAAGLPVVD